MSFDTSNITPNTISDNDVEKIKEVLKENLNKDDKLLADLPSNNGVEESDGTGIPEEAEVTVKTNPNTGALNSIEADIDKETARLLDIDLEELYNLPKSESELPFDPELLTSNAKEYGIEDNDIAALLPVIDKFRKSLAPDSINWYNELPDNIKKNINNECALLGNNSTTAKKMFSSELIKGLIRDTGIDKITIDLQESMKQAMDLSPMMKLSVDYQRTLFEEGIEKNINILKNELPADMALVDSIEKLKEEYIAANPDDTELITLSKIGFTDKLHCEKTIKNFESCSVDDITSIIKSSYENLDNKVNSLERVKEAYVSSYKLDDFKDKLRTKKIKVKPFDISKYSKYCMEFLYKYEKNTPFIIHDISACVPVLCRKFPEFTSDQVAAMIIGFIKYTANMDSANVNDHTFMSYFISNIINLDLIKDGDEEEGAFTNILLSNLKECIMLVNDIKPDAL